MVGDLAARPVPSLPTDDPRIGESAQTVTQYIRACPVEEAFEFGVPLGSRKERVHDVQRPAIAHGGERICERIAIGLLDGHLLGNRKHSVYSRDLRTASN